MLHGVAWCCMVLIALREITYHNLYSLPLVRLLIKHGADVNKESTVFYGKDCDSPSFETCQEPPVVTAARVACPLVLQCLIRNGAGRECMHCSCALWWP